jgi:hypothetical protein
VDTSGGTACAGDESIFSSTRAGHQSDRDGAIHTDAVLHNERLTRLDDERNQAYYKNAVLLAINGLSHLYFGFALLVEAAMGS